MVPTPTATKSPPSRISSQLPKPPESSLAPVGCWAAGASVAGPSVASSSVTSSDGGADSLADGVALGLADALSATLSRTPVTDWPAAALIDLALGVAPSAEAPRSIRPGAIGLSAEPPKLKLPLPFVFVRRSLPALSRSMTSAPEIGSPLESTTLPETVLTVCGCCGGGAALPLTVRLKLPVAASDLSGCTCTVTEPLASPALSFARMVSSCVLGIGLPGAKLTWPQPETQLTPEGRPVMPICAFWSPSPGVTRTVTVVSLPALSVTEPGETLTSAARAGVAGTVSRAPKTSATTTPARCFQARRCVDTSTAFRV